MTIEREPSLQPKDRVEATKLHSWTVEQFDDYPLIIEPGNQGVVDEILDEEECVYITWDKDKFSHMRKSLSFQEALTLKKIEEQS
ncbi:MAG TPA: hypothetical protein VMX76_02845 [Nevskiaceae bacterium]|nr:hypothetical protein [Nevskiaceae bacterium]